MWACRRDTVALASSAPSWNTTSLRRMTRCSASVSSAMRPMLVRAFSERVLGRFGLAFDHDHAARRGRRGGAALGGLDTEYSISKTRSPASAVSHLHGKIRAAIRTRRPPGLRGCPAAGARRRRSGGWRGAPHRRKRASPSCGHTERRGVRGRRSAPCLRSLPESRDGPAAARWNAPAPNMRSVKRRKPRSMAFSISENRLMAESGLILTAALTISAAAGAAAVAAVHSIFHQHGERDLARRPLRRARSR